MSTSRVRRTRQPQVSAKISTFGGVKRADTSRQVTYEDTFPTHGLASSALLPPFTANFLYTCLERSNMLRQCVAAMVTNVALGGFEIAAVSPTVPINEAEKEELESFISTANSEESLTTVHSKVAQDYETYGYAFVEVIRDRKGRVSLLRHAKSFYTRLMPKDDDLQTVQYEVNRGERTSTITEVRAFRRFVQMVNGVTRYFKEFGDQRVLHMDTGVYGTCPVEFRASEIVHFRQMSEDPYGVPRWINQIPSVLGSRESEECNLRYFQDNTIPPMILSVAGGRLTRQSHKDLHDILQKEGLGAERQHKLLLIEAVPERESLDEKGATVTLKIDKLTDARQSDGLFKEYDESNQSKIRSSFRLPPIAVGLSSEVNFATARVSAFIAETQVYLPMRNIFDEVYNKMLVSNELGLGLKTCKLVSRVPLASDVETIIKSMTALNVMGALTPRMANKLGNQLLQIDLPEYPEAGAEGYDEWMDKPMSLALRGATDNIHVGQGQKDNKLKETEATGMVGQQAPENGQQ